MTEIATPMTIALTGAAQVEDLEDWGPLAEATGPEMRTAGTTIWHDGDDEVGVWECTPGPSRWLLETNEFIYVLKGSMTVTVEGGHPLELKAGDVALFPKGWSGAWEIHETLRKAYVIF